MTLRNPAKTALFPLSIIALVALGACGGSSSGDDEGDDASSSDTEAVDTTLGETSVGTTMTTTTTPGTESSSSDDAADSESEDSGTEDGTGTEAGTGTDTDTETDTDTGGVVEPSFAMLDLSRPIDLTPDGSIALVEDPSDIMLDAFFYDTVTGELEFAATIGDAAFNFSTGISEDLRISALHGVPVQAGLWTEANGWMDLASPFEVGCDDIASAWDVSADGTVAIGMAWDGCSPAAFRWVDDGGAGTLTVLDVLGTGFNGNAPTNRATVVSDDGMVVAGFAQNGGAVDRAAAVWQADGTGIMLAPEEEWPQEVLSISADGHMVAGTRGYDGFYWTESQGMVSLGKLPEVEAPTNTFPNAMAQNGELIAGGFGDPWGWSLPVAFVWTAADGMRSLQTLIEDNGLDVPEGVVLTNVIAASADGTVLLGNGLDAEGYTRSFVVRLPVSAYGL